MIDIDKFRFQRDAIHINGGSVFFAYGHRCVDEPRLVVMDKSFKATRTTVRSYVIDGVDSYETPEQAAYALGVPPVLTADEMELLARAPVDWTAVEKRGDYYSLYQKGLVEFQKSDQGFQIRKRGVTHG